MQVAATAVLSADLLLLLGHVHDDHVYGAGEGDDLLLQRVQTQHRQSGSETAYSQAAMNIF